MAKARLRRTQTLKTSSLADIYKSEKKQGGGLVSALGKSMKESFDPRNLLDQKGLMVSMFPSLKGYKAIPKKGFG